MLSHSSRLQCNDPLRQLDLVADWAHQETQVVTLGEGLKLEAILLLV